MANQIVCVVVETYGLRIYAIKLPPSDFSVNHCVHSNSLGSLSLETLHYGAS